MSESTPPPESSEPATGPVLTPPPPPAASQPPVYHPAPPQYAPTPDNNRLNKAAAWVGIVAGSVIIVAVIFGTGFFVGKEVGGGPRGDAGHHMMLRPAAPMFPMGPRSDAPRGPGFPGPFGPGGPVIEIPGQSGQGDSPTPGRSGN
ncbi:hypothetical protein FIV07_25290 [Mycobacterium sp. THAF192]|nr:hypothetical protein FIV07_25290 [Mycobacterium sp. THAF192]